MDAQKTKKRSLVLSLVFAALVAIAMVFVVMTLAKAETTQPVDGEAPASALQPVDQPKQDLPANDQKVEKEEAVQPDNNVSDESVNAKETNDYIGLTVKPGSKIKYHDYLKNVDGELTGNTLFKISSSLDNHRLGIYYKNEIYRIGEPYGYTMHFVDFTYNDGKPTNPRELYAFYNTEDTNIFSGATVGTNPVLEYPRVTLYNYQGDADVTLNRTGTRPAAPSFEATFYGNGGKWNGQETITVSETYFENYSLPEDPVREGFVLYSYIDEDGNPVNANTKSLHNAAFKVDAVWANEIVYNFDGGTPAPGVNTKQLKVENKAVQLYNTGMVTKPGYTLSGWRDTETSKLYKPGETISENKNINLVAVWDREVTTTVFDGNGGTWVGPEGEEITSKSIEQTTYEDFRLPDSPYKEGYRFSHWEDENGNVIDSNTQVPEGGIARVIAQYDQLTYFNIASKNNLEFTVSRQGAADQDYSKFVYETTEKGCVGEEPVKNADGSWTIDINKSDGTTYISFTLKPKSNTELTNVSLDSTTETEINYGVDVSENAVNLRGTVSSQTQDPEVNKPLANHKVELVTTSTGERRTATTDEDGFYSFDDLTSSGGLHLVYVYSNDTDETIAEIVFDVDPYSGVDIVEDINVDWDVYTTFHGQWADQSSNSVETQVIQKYNDNYQFPEDPESTSEHEFVGWKFNLDDEEFVTEDTIVTKSKAHDLYAVYVDHPTPTPDPQPSGDDSGSQSGATGDNPYVFIALVGLAAVAAIAVLRFRKDF